MPGTLEGLAVVLIALLPGALVVFAFERVAGRWAIGVGERILRFIGTSAILYALLAPVTYLLWFDYLRGDGLDTKLPLWLWPIAVAYVALPLAVGCLLAWAYTRFSWAQGLGARPPTAWDSVFVGDPHGWVLLRLKSERWVGGRYDEDSYAGGYPEPADIYLEAEGVVDQDTEDFVVGNDGGPIRSTRTV